MKLRRNRSQGIQPGDRVTITGTVRVIGPAYLGSQDVDALIDVDLDQTSLPDGAKCTLRIDVRALGGLA